MKHERTLLHVRTSPDGRSEETLAEPPSSDVVPDRVYHVTGEGTKGTIVYMCWTSTSIIVVSSKGDGVCL